MTFLQFSHHFSGLVCNMASCTNPATIGCQHFVLCAIHFSEHTTRVRDPDPSSDVIGIVHQYQHSYFSALRLRQETKLTRKVVPTCLIFYYRCVLMFVMFLLPYSWSLWTLVTTLESWWDDLGLSPTHVQRWSFVLWQSFPLLFLCIVWFFSCFIHWCWLLCEGFNFIFIVVRFNKRCLPWHWHSRGLACMRSRLEKKNPSCQSYQKRTNREHNWWWMLLAPLRHYPRTLTTSFCILQVTKP